MLEGPVAGTKSCAVKTTITTTRTKNAYSLNFDVKGLTWPRR
jgi:hypothetical protein